MMDPMSGKNRGYAFLTYCEKSSAQEAAKKVAFPFHANLFSFRSLVTLATL